MKNPKSADTQSFKTETGSGMELATAEKLRMASRQDRDAVYETLDSSTDGISEKTANDRIATYGLKRSMRFRLIFYDDA